MAIRGGYAAILFLLVALNVAAGDGTSRLQRIQFLRGEHVLVMNGDGSGQHRSALPGYAYWSPDGGRIAFARSRGPQRTGLYVANADGGGSKRIANVFVGSDCFQPWWSPSGRDLSYQTGCDNDETALFVIHRDGTHRRQLARGKWTLPAKWSADGKFVVFAAASAPPRTSDTYALFVAGARGGKPRRIPGLQFRFLYGVDWAWSHGGERIYLLAETRDTSNRGLELSSIGRRGGRLRALTPPELNVGAFEVSRDGREIVLQAATGTRDWEIYVIRADGTGLVQLTDNRAHDREPHWSADGRRILFTSERDRNYEIYVMDREGNSETNLTRNPADDHDAVWVPAR
jgi:Tol biopolymer transport system component